MLFAKRCRQLKCFLNDADNSFQRLIGFSVVFIAVAKLNIPTSKPFMMSLVNMNDLLAKSRKDTISFFFKLAELTLMVLFSDYTHHLSQTEWLRSLSIAKFLLIRSDLLVITFFFSYLLLQSFYRGIS